MMHERRGSERTGEVGIEETKFSRQITLDEALSELGFKHLWSDTGLFLYQQGEEWVLVVVYVDNLIFAGPDKVICVNLKCKVMEKWQCHKLGETSEFLHMGISRDEKGNTYLEQ